ncbi:hypothetical protein CEXT_648531 [Caerostris extrusa]|uniref:Uncharacterized protein n=1 Tax=Caerostris extrusa TaxID=172846 RepID=A0AAV4V4D8_CAEEX|nr:hypothetical protein CEXT_648531 [Caerostris extrusa]
MGHRIHQTHSASLTVIQVALSQMTQSSSQYGLPASTTIACWNATLLRRLDIKLGAWNSLKRLTTEWNLSPLLFFNPRFRITPSRRLRPYFIAVVGILLTMAPDKIWIDVVS